MQNNVMTVISEMLVKKEASKGSTILIDAADDKKGLKYDVVKEEVADAREVPGNSHDNGEDSIVDSPAVITSPAPSLYRRLYSRFGFALK